MNIWKYVFILEAFIVFRACLAAVGDDLRDAEIYNGQDAKTQHHRWVVWIRQNGKLLCGGALISKLYAVTAAQCVKHVFVMERREVKRKMDYSDEKEDVPRYQANASCSVVNHSKALEYEPAHGKTCNQTGAANRDSYQPAHSSTMTTPYTRPGRYQVVVGDYDRSSIDGTEAFINVAERHLHPDYRMTLLQNPTFNRYVMENDIAVLRLETPADTSSTNIKRINKFSTQEIDQRIQSNESATCYVTGWGYNYYGSFWMLSARLQELQIQIMNESRCSDVMLDAYDPQTRLCFETSDSGTCMGDNGGPWVCKLDNRWILVGIQSYGIIHDGCRAGGWAGTRISYYSDWIQSLTKTRDRKRLQANNVSQTDPSK